MVEQSEHGGYGGSAHADRATGRLVDTFLTRERATARRHTAMWFAIAIALMPVVDRLDDAGWLIGLAELEGSAPSWIALAWSLFFAALGAAAGALLVRHRRRDRRIFFVGCAIPIAIYAAFGDWRVSALAAGLAWVVAGLRLAELERSEGTHGPERGSNPERPISPAIS